MERIRCLFDWCGEPVDVLSTTPKPMIERHELPGEHGGGVCPASLMSWPHTERELASLGEQSASMSDRIMDAQVDAVERRKLKSSNPISGERDYDSTLDDLAYEKFRRDNPPSMFNPGPGGSDRHHPGLNVKDERLLPGEPGRPLGRSDRATVGQDYASRGDGTVLHIQCGTLHRPGQLCPMGSVPLSPGEGENLCYGKGEPPHIAQGPGSEDCEICKRTTKFYQDRAKRAVEKSREKLNQSVSGGNGMSSINEVVGMINGAAVTTNEGIAAIQTAKDKIAEGKGAILEVLGTVHSDTLNEYVATLNRAVETLDQAINQINHSHELGEEYIGRLFS